MKPLCCFVFGGILLASSGTALADGDKGLLIGALTALRASTLGHAVAGRGAATVEGDHYGIGAEQVVINDQPTPKHRVTFAFNGSTAIWDIDNGKMPASIYFSKQVQAGHLTSYVRNGPKQTPWPSSFTISACPYPSIVLEPEAWSLDQFMKLPIWEEGDSYLSSLVTASDATVHAAGTLVIVDVARKIPENPRGDKSQVEHYEFDKAMGGLLTRMTWEASRVKEKETLDRSTTLEWTWEKRDGTFCPRERLLHLVVKRNGIECEKGWSRIVFEKVAIEPVPERELSIAQWHVPWDTHVIGLSPPTKGGRVDPKDGY